MEIERKWLVNGWPDAALGLSLQKEHAMEQGYISTRPTVRLRKEALLGGQTEYILCFKSGAGLVREEIELQLEEPVFANLAQKILAKPMIPKLRRSYALPDGLVLEVSEVDKGQATSFFYAEIEFASETQAQVWKPEAVSGKSNVQNDSEQQSLLGKQLAQYLNNEVTYEKGQSMAEYWVATRG